MVTALPDVDSLCRWRMPKGSNERRKSPSIAAGGLAVGEGAEIENYRWRLCREKAVVRLPGRGSGKLDAVATMARMLHHRAVVRRSVVR